MLSVRGINSNSIIAASKDLLEALIELKRWVVDTHVASEALNSANKAIKKALN